MTDSLHGTRPGRMCVLVPPVLPVDSPALGATIVADIARAASWQVEVLYAGLLVRHSDFITYSVAGPAAYGPVYRAENSQDYSTKLLEALTQDAISTGEWSGVQAFERVRRAVQDELDGALREAGDLVDEVTTRIMRSDPPDLVAISISVDAQKLPSAAIATNLRRSGYRGIIIAGGSGLDGIMGPAFLRCFSAFDVVLQGEAESNWSNFLASFSGSWRDAEIPGMVLADTAGACATEPRVPSALWQLHSNAFDDYIAQRPEHSASLVLSAESSRGCWWAEIRRCTFCAVDPRLHPYRTQRPATVAATLGGLWAKHQPAQFTMTDSCMPRAQDSNVAAQLVERSERSEWNLYYEVKSTLSRSALAELKAGGISEIQPGIESFSTKILRDFGKGASCLQHVNLLKWCKAYAIAVTYPILFGAPTEDPADLLAMVEVIKRIEHLPPPVQMNRLRLYRGSGYWDRREEYGFTKVEPTACDQLGYGKEVTSLEDVVFNFNYTLAKHAGPAYLAAVTTLRMAISDWQRNYHRSILVSAFTAENVVITRKSSVEAHLEVIEDPVRLYILRSCEEIGRLNQICRDLELPREEFDRHISDLVDAGLLMKEGGRALTLAVPVVESRRTEDISKRGLQ